MTPRRLLRLLVHIIHDAPHHTTPHHTTDLPALTTLDLWRGWRCLVLILLGLFLHSAGLTTLR